MKFIRSAAVVSLLFPASALAQNPAPAAAAPALAPAPTPAVAPATAPAVERHLAPYSYIEGALVLADSTSGAAPFFKVNVLRLGVRYTEGIVHGQTTWSLNGVNTFEIRDGFVGVTLPNMVGDFTADLGRVRPVTIGDFGAWARNAGHQYGDMNGVHLAHSFKLADANAEAHAYYGTDISEFTECHQGYAAERPSKAEKAFIVTAKATAMDAIKVAMTYASEPLALQTVPTANAAGTAVDTALMGFSAGYDREGIKGGVYYTKKDFGKVKSVTLGDKSDTIEVDDSVPNAETSYETILGFGASAESGVVGIENVLQQGGKFVLGASYEMLGFKDDDKNAKQLSASLGYLVAGLDVELNFVQLNTKAKVLSDAKGKATSTASTVYLSAAIEI